MIVRYINSRNEEVNLNQKPYKMLISDIMNYDWEVLESSGKITGFAKKISRKSVLVDVFSDVEDSSRKNVNRLTDIFEYDVINKTPGRLYINDCYLNCFFIKGDKSNWGTNIITSCEYGLVTDKPYWITEETFRFSVTGTTETAADDVNYLKCPYDYPYDYAPDKTIAYLENDSIGSCDFEMKIFGPCTNPIVRISENIYEIRDTLREYEYITITSNPKKIIKHLADGTEQNIMNSRNKKYGIEKIKPGMNVINRNGDFSVEITIYKARSEPKW